MWIVVLFWKSVLKLTCVFCESADIDFAYFSDPKPAVSIVCHKCGGTCGRCDDKESAVYKWNRAWKRVNEPKLYSPNSSTVVCGQWKLRWEPVTSQIVWERQAKVVLDQK